MGRLCYLVINCNNYNDQNSIMALPQAAILTLKLQTLLTVRLLNPCVWRCVWHLGRTFEAKEGLGSRVYEVWVEKDRKEPV